MFLPSQPLRVGLGGGFFEVLERLVVEFAAQVVVGDACEPVA